VVVCSARSADTKAEGTTNRYSHVCYGSRLSLTKSIRLLRAAREAEDPESKTYVDIVHAIQEDHIHTAERYIVSPAILEGLGQAIRRECQNLVAFLGAAQIIREVSSRTEDIIISTGEKLSSMFVAALLRDRGVDAEYVDLENIILAKGIEELDTAFYEKLANNLAARVIACGTKVPVLTGYFGQIPGGLLTRVGRGYTDLCAALVAVGLRAHELQVWKEVDGIFTADPRKVPTARLISSITPAEASELTFYGSEVIHPFTMEQLIRARIPIRIKNVMNPRGNGTIIYPDTFAESGSDSPVAESPSFRVRHRKKVLRPRRPTAVTTKRNIVVLNVHSNKRSLSYNFYAKLFTTLKKWRLSVDVISTSEVHISIALHSENAMLSGIGEEDMQIVDQDLRGAIEELSEVGTVDIINGMAILSLVGKEMKDMVGIAGRMFSTLGDNNINIEMISQGEFATIWRLERYANKRLTVCVQPGASEINISCVIEEREADRALNVLHTHLFTFLE
jgi:aspartate kinase